MKLSDKLTYQNHNFKIRFKEKDAKGRLGFTTKGYQCFSLIRNYNESGKTALIYCKENLLSAYTDDEVKLYCELINKIPFIKFQYSKKGDTHFFLLKYKDYAEGNHLVAILMIIRYLWENHNSSSGDVFYKVPGYFIKLVEKYPEEDLLYLLLWADLSITDFKGNNQWNINHSLRYSGIQYPFKYEDLKWHAYSVSGTFNKKEKQDYNKTIEEYKQELKDFKIFENE